MMTTNEVKIGGAHPIGSEIRLGFNNAGIIVGPRQSDFGPQISFNTFTESRTILTSNRTHDDLIMKVELPKRTANLRIPMYSLKTHKMNTIQLRIAETAVLTEVMHDAKLIDGVFIIVDEIFYRGS